MLHHCALCHRGPEGIDRYDGIGEISPDAPQCHLQPSQFLLFIDKVSTRTCGACAHIDDGAPLLNNLRGTTCHSFLALHTAGREKRVGCGIEDTHYHRRREVEQPTAYVYRCVHDAYNGSGSENHRNLF